ncbi:MAG: DUF1700 domain-containing protein [Acetatifactor sp.]|nr:DUF1700 domain-containing protein [Acetatifactor sp.]
MNKQEFLEELKESLSGQVPPNEINENISYYKDYIENNPQGKSEQETIDEIGNPRFIAKSIIDTYTNSHGEYRESSYQENTGYGNGNSNGNFYGGGNTYGSGDSEYSYYNGAHVTSTSIFHKIWNVISLVLVVLAISFLIIAGVTVFVHFILPIILIWILVRFLIRVFQGE